MSVVMAPLWQGWNSALSNKPTGPGLCFYTLCVDEGYL